MESKSKISFEKDLDNNRFIVTRQFDGTVEQVWRAWTESTLLDQWWAPKPYRAETKSMDFKVGGRWLYAMVGPDETKMWCKVDYTAITDHKSFEAIDAFCDENGVTSNEFPAMTWKNTFQPKGVGTEVIVEVFFKSAEDMQKIAEMGFEQGFTMALGNLDELMEKGIEN